MQKVTEWTTSKNQKITVTTSVEHVLLSNGNRSSDYRRVIEQSISIDGKRTMGWIEEIDHPVAVACIKGENIGIIKCNMDKINADLEACEASAEYQSYIAQRGKNLVEVADYDQHSKNVESMLILNGKTY